MKILSFLLLSLIIVSCANKPVKVYQWRGENRTGIFPEKNLLKVWPENGPAENWFVEGIGNGFGSPTITDNEIFITGEIDSTATLFCISYEGKILWKTEFGKEWTASYPGSRSAPTVAGDLIYVGSGMGNLFCIKRTSGEVLWSKNFKKDFNGIHPRFGHSEAPVIDDNKVFWTPGGKDFNVVALDRFTGELIWKNKAKKERSGYNPGYLIRLPERHIFVTFTAYHLLGFDTETGELLWWHEQTNTTPEERKPGVGDTHSNCILFDNGYIYYVAGDGNGGVKLKLSDDGKQIEQVWQNTQFDSYMGAFVKPDNFLYATGTSKKQLKSIDSQTGELADSLQLGWGAIIAADQHIYYYSQNGTLSLIEYDNGKMKQISHFKIQRGRNQHFSHPVINNGVLYQRHGNVLIAFDVKEKS